MTTFNAPTRAHNFSAGPAALPRSVLERAHSELFVNKVHPQRRSRMNVVFELPNQTLTQRFLDLAEEAEMMGLKGHRSVGGLRASLYNAVEPESVEELCSLMIEFERRNG